MISHYASGRKLSALDTLSRLCPVLDLDANEILCVKKPKQYYACLQKNTAFQPCFYFFDKRLFYKAYVAFYVLVLRGIKGKFLGVHERIVEVDSVKLFFRSLICNRQLFRGDLLKKKTRQTEIVVIFIPYKFYARIHGYVLQIQAKRKCTRFNML